MPPPSSRRPTIPSGTLPEWCASPPAGGSVRHFSNASTCPLPPTGKRRSVEVRRMPHCNHLISPRSITTSTGGHSPRNSYPTVMENGERLLAFTAIWRFRRCFDIQRSIGQTWRCHRKLNLPGIMGTPNDNQCPAVPCFTVICCIFVRVLHIGIIHPCDHTRPI